MRTDLGATPFRRHDRRTDLLLDGSMQRGTPGADEPAVTARYLCGIEVKTALP
jgi:hypothetical protein